MGVLNFEMFVQGFEYFRAVFVQLFEEGLGPGRPKLELVEATQLPEVQLDLTPSREPIDWLKIVFLTPTELKTGGNLVRSPEFGPLFGRARDRVSAICRLYQGGSPDFDFIGMGARAKAVTMKACAVQEVEVVRKSGRTGQRYGMGGFIGSAEYEGDLTEFLPILKAAEYTGVGRLTVWGHGAIRIDAVRLQPPLDPH